MTPRVQDLWTKLRSARVDRWVFGAIALWAVLLQFTAAIEVGGLWRDEVNTLNLARFPTLWGMLTHNHYDSFPVLYAVLLRGWLGLGLGESDVGLRFLGFATGCALLAAVCWCGWLFARRLPILSLALLSVAPTVFRFTNGLRAYQLGAVTMLLMLGAIWYLLERTSWRTALFLFLATLAAVQSVFVNAFLVFATYLAAGILCLRMRNARAIAVLAVSGTLCCLSLLPYIATFRSHSQWSHLMHREFELSWISARVVDALGEGLSFQWSVLAWPLLAVVAAAATGATLVRTDPASARGRQGTIFVATMLIAGVLGHLAYLRFLSVHTTIWYYLPVMVLAALACDAAINLFPRGRRGDWAYLAAAVGIVALQSEGAWTAAHTKVTNYDVMAQRVGDVADPGDFIVVQPWYTAVTFQRYYTGKAAWTALPDADRTFEHYAPLLKKMGEEKPIQSILDEADRTLRSGKRVFVVGHIAPLFPGEQPGDLRPSTDQGRTGPKDQDYVMMWLRQLTAFLRGRSRETQMLHIALGVPVVSWEKGSVFIFQGYRNTPRGDDADVRATPPPR